MRRLCQFFLHVISFTSAIVVQRTDSCLFRREKAFHQLINDPYQAEKREITAENLFKDLNMKHQIKFKLWTRKNPRWAQEIVIGNIDSVRKSNYDFRKLTKIILHGWAHSANEISMEDWILRLRDAYLRLADLNIIFIDYTMLALFHMYFSASPSLAGQRLSELITFLVKNGADYSHFHVLGYSWGAHVAGIAGQKLNGSLARITGMDPANPTFRLVDNVHRLDKTDAVFVDIIHTGGGPFVEGYLGLNLNLGHADFYPNGGEIQPGCEFHWTRKDESIECNHGRSVWYFAESINSPHAFPACKCQSWETFAKGNCSCNSEEATFMGEFTPHRPQTDGVYYLATRGESPYGMGPFLNLTLQSFDEYDPNLIKYDHTNHNFTGNSASQYLTEVVQKSLARLPPPYSAMHEHKGHPTPDFRSSLLNKLKRNYEKIQHTMERIQNNENEGEYPHHKQLEFKIQGYKQQRL